MVKKVNALIMALITSCLGCSSLNKDEIRVVEESEIAHLEYRFKKIAIRDVKSKKLLSRGQAEDFLDTLPENDIDEEDLEKVRVNYCEFETPIQLESQELLIAIRESLLNSDPQSALAKIQQLKAKCSAVIYTSNILYLEAKALLMNGTERKAVNAKLEEFLSFAETANPFTYANVDTVEQSKAMENLKYYRNQAKSFIDSSSDNLALSSPNFSGHSVKYFDGSPKTNYSFSGLLGFNINTFIVSNEPGPMESFRVYGVSYGYQDYKFLLQIGNSPGKSGLVEIGASQQVYKSKSEDMKMDAFIGYSQFTRQRRRDLHSSDYSYDELSQKDYGYDFNLGLGLYKNFNNRFSTNVDLVVSENSSLNFTKVYLNPELNLSFARFFAVGVGHRFGEKEVYFDMGFLRIFVEIEDDGLFGLRLPQHRF